VNTVKTLKTSIAVLGVAVLAIWAAKRYYADANADDLWWMLAPTARLAGAVAGVPFTPAPGEGYFSPDRLFLIEKSCAGINFMIAAFGMVTLALVHRVQSASSGLRLLIAAFLTSYVAALGVNASRIAVAMWLATHQAGAGVLSAAEVHRLEGIAVYFGGLVLLYELVRAFDRRTPPVELQP